MVSGMKKAMVYLGLRDDDDLYEEELRAETQRRENEKKHNAAAEAPQEESDPAPAENQEPQTKSASGSHLVELVNDDYRAKVTPIKRVATNREEAQDVHQLTTIHPRSYNDAKLIGEAFRSGIPVIMNVTDMSEAEAKRLVDFSAGLVFGLYGSIERVTNKVFLLTPTTIEVVTEGASQPEEDTTFFNQA